MSKSWAWIAPYIFATLAVLMAGPVLSSLAWVQSVSVPYVTLSGPHAIRLIAHLLALGILWALGFAASQSIQDNGRGSQFLRRLVLPLNWSTWGKIRRSSVSWPSPCYSATSITTTSCKRSRHGFSSKQNPPGVSPPQHRDDL